MKGEIITSNFLVIRLGGMVSFIRNRARITSMEITTTILQRMIKERVTTLEIPSTKRRTTMDLLSILFLILELIIILMRRTECIE